MNMASNAHGAGPSGSVSDFTVEQVAQIALVDDWVQQQKVLGRTVRIIFVNGILHDLDKSDDILPICTAMTDRFDIEHYWWLKNPFLSYQMIAGVLRNLYTQTQQCLRSETAPYVGVAAAALCALDLTLTGGRTTLFLGRYVAASLSGCDVRSVALTVASSFAHIMWGREGENTQSLNRILAEYQRRDDGAATLLVGHSFGAMSLATAHPNIQQPAGSAAALLLLGSPLNTPPDPNLAIPIFSITHEQDVIHYFRDINDVAGDGAERELLSAEAHSLATYTKLFRI
jgi:hypothetical protein